MEESGYKLFFRRGMMIPSLNNDTESLGVRFIIFPSFKIILRTVLRNNFGLKSEIKVIRQTDEITPRHPMSKQLC